MRMSGSRKVILGCGMSLDGYIARKDGGIDWLVQDPDYDFGELFGAVDVYIMGRKTLDEAFKRGATKSSFGGKAKSYVFSRTHPSGNHDGFHWISGSPAKLVAELKSQPGKDIFLMGGGELAREFLREDLVDQLQLGFLPVLLGDGVQLFPPGFPQRNFRLTMCRSYSKTGLVAMTYERAAKKENEAKPKRKGRAKKN
jgi:dihydrofolate reductase